ncbi:glycosyltransferase family 2 protein [Candidatus Woesearchaeota archaeon]|nr:glycosyltransferase family 2 protein [Candidatus Woesearchaeota archaeon]
MDIIMAASSVMFGLLLLFLAFVSAVYIASFFAKRTFPEFEPKISIVIPAHNEAKNIGKCLEAVFASNYPPAKMEVIVVDDGSTDNTATAAKRYNEVKLLKQLHKGKAEALTLGAKAAKHAFILALDADTMMETDCVKEAVKPFADKKIGATSGVFRVKNSHSILGMFQNVEYYYHNIIRTSFSQVFGHGVWFFGAMSCYRKEVLQEIGWFKQDTLTEDMDISLEIRRAGYKTFSVRQAVSATIVPETLAAFYRQRSRWWLGGMQSLRKNRQLLKQGSSVPIAFLFINQFWWSIYAVLSLPVIIYQVSYWMPAGTESIAYLFRWFTLSGPLYVLYKIPEWGISAYSIFGVLSGAVSAAIMTLGIYSYKDKLHLRNAAALFLYFPYTIILNMVIFISLLRFKAIKTRFYLK